MDQYAEEKRTEKNLIVRSKPKQLIIKDCAQRFVLRHEASHGLFATAELLVSPSDRVDPPFYGNIPTETSLTGASYARGYEKNRDILPISRLAMDTMEWE